MSLGQDIHRDAGPPDGEDEIEVSAPMDLIISDPASSLDDLEEPSPEELAELEAEEAREAEPPALLAAPNEPLEKSELVSLESLDEVDELDELDDDDELDEEDGFSDPPIDSYIDIDMDDGDLNDEGYDLDDDAEIADYQDLYGEDDGVVPSFREGELDDDDDESGGAFYGDLHGRPVWMA